MSKLRIPRVTHLSAPPADGPRTDHGRPSSRRTVGDNRRFGTGIIRDGVRSERSTLPPCRGPGVEAGLGREKSSTELTRVIAKSRKPTRPNSTGIGGKRPPPGRLARVIGEFHCHHTNCENEYR